MKKQFQTTEITSRGRKMNLPKHLNEHKLYTSYCLLSIQQGPITCRDAINDKEWNYSLEKRQTWSKTQLQEEKKAIQTK